MPTDALSESERPLDAQAYPGRLQQYWLIFVVLLIATLGYLDRQMVALLVTPIKNDLQLTDTQLGFLIGGAFALSNIIFTLPAGWAVDRFGRRTLLGAGAVVWSVMTATCGLAANYTHLVLARAGVGAAESVIQPASFAMLRSEISVHRQGRAFGIYYMANMIGTSGALLAGGALLAVIGAAQVETLPLVGDLRPWQIALIATGILGIPVSLLALTIREPMRKVANVEKDETGYREALTYIRANLRYYAPLWVAMVSFVTLVTGTGAWTPAMMERSYGMPLGEVGVALGVRMLLASPPGLLLMGWIIDVARRKAGMEGVTLTALLVTLVMAISAALVPQAPTAATYLLAITASFLVSQGPMPAFAAILSIVTPPRMMGKISAIQFFIVGFVAVTMGPALVALIADNLFSGNRALANALSLLAVVCGVIAVTAIWILHRQARRGLALQV